MKLKILKTKKLHKNCKTNYCVCFLYLNIMMFLWFVIVINISTSMWQHMITMIGKSNAMCAKCDFKLHEIIQVCVQSYHFKLIIHATSFQGIIKANNSTWIVNLYNYRDQYHILCTKKSVHLKLQISLYILHPKIINNNNNYLAHSLMKKLAMSM